MFKAIEGNATKVYYVEKKIPKLFPVGEGEEIKNVVSSKFRNNHDGYPNISVSVKKQTKESDKL